MRAAGDAGDRPALTLALSQGERGPKRPPLPSPLSHLPSTCYPPTVLFYPPADSRVMTHEVFGPVVCVSPFDGLDEAVARANSLPYAFQAAVFTRDLDTALRASRR